MRAGDPGAVLTAAQRRAADTGHKAMMPIRGRPFLDYLLSAIADAGIVRVALVVAPDHAALRRYYEETAPPSRAHLTFIVQPEAKGTADAVRAAAAWTGGDAFLVMNSDNLYPVTALRDLAALDEPGLPGFEAGDLVRTGNITPDRIASFALLDVDSDGYLTRIVEKPGTETDTGTDSPAARRTSHPAPSTRHPAPGLSHSAISMNVFRFDSRIFDICGDVPRSIRGEYELPEAVGFALTRGMRFKVIPARGPVLDLSRRADAADVERRLAGVEVQP